MKCFLTSSLLNVSPIRTFLSVLFVAIALTGVSLAAPVFSQRVANPSSSDAGTISDVNGLSNRGATWIGLLSFGPNATSTLSRQKEIAFNAKCLLVRPLQWKHIFVIAGFAWPL